LAVKKTLEQLDIEYTRSCFQELTLACRDQRVWMGEAPVPQAPWQDARTTESASSNRCWILVVEIQPRNGRFSMYSQPDQGNGI